MSYSMESIASTGSRRLTLTVLAVRERADEWGLENERAPAWPIPALGKPLTSM